MVLELLDLIQEVQGKMTVENPAMVTAENQVLMTADSLVLMTGKGDWFSWPDTQHIKQVALK